MARLLFFAVCLAFTSAVRAQTPFGDGCLGVWQGTMYIYNQGSLKDSVNVRLTVAHTATADAWTWRTEYLSAKMPVTKDYVLRLKDAKKGVYLTDEGDGVALTDYLFGNKLYSVFETGGVMLTSTYERTADTLIFEVTAGKKQPGGSVTTYSVDTLQRVVFRKAS